MSEYEPVLIEILVEVMDPSFVCSVSSARRCGFSGSVTWEVAWTQEGMRCLAMGQSPGMGCGSQEAGDSGL